jgi:hypothetical protein
MDGPGDTLDVLIISLGDRAVGIDSVEIEKVIPGFRSGERYSVLLEEYRGRMYGLEALAGSSAPERPASALIVKTGEDDRRLVTFSGTMEVKRLRTMDILPAPEYVRAHQQPFVVWGFVAAESGSGRRLIPLVTFQFLPEKGSS